jgi:pimeloyl-ACP methyl ester carboxylesterase
MAALTHRAALEVGVRIISPDRPGIGLSQFQPGRTVPDWPLVFEGLANALGIGSYRVLGVSGGSPYALVSAWANPAAVKAVAVVSGAPPLAGQNTADGLLPAYDWLLEIYRTSPAMIRFLFRVLRPVALLPLLNISKAMLLSIQLPADRAALRRDHAFEVCFESSRAAWKQNAGGVTHDAELYARPWGFDPGEIRTPVRLWHGKLDRSFSWKLADALAEKIPGCTPHFLEDEGHYSLPILHVRRILEDLKNTGA